ncbi:MAG: glycosyltransferase, partial [Pseudonocardiales bacterium]|nr:glycosyltransferase [Pseudonocardiales bacterium]
MVAPPWYELPPKGYGGIESMCADLVAGLLQLGVEVTLIGVGRNGTEARFIPTLDQPQCDRMGDAMPDVLHAAALPEILSRLAVDIVHDHSFLGPLLAAGREVATVVTAHGPLSGDMGRYYRSISNTVNLVAISQAQRSTAPELRWAATVHNAVRICDFPYRGKKADFALFLGRLAPEKGLADAIDAAACANVELVIAAKASEAREQEYFEREIVPRLGPKVHWLGEADHVSKRELLASARCLLFPIAWEEPFGMVMIEALACGTPVVALRRGSVPEIVRHGVTGLICDSRDELPAALRRVVALDPAACRADAANRFD